jgi:hypothetical protein
MPLSVSPPKEDTKKAGALKTADKIYRALQRPNRNPSHNLYNKMIRAIVRDMITIGFAGIERFPPTDDNQAFWLFPLQAVGSQGQAYLQVSSQWTPQTSRVRPLYYDHSVLPARPIFSEEAFLIQADASSFELIPPSPLETAFRMVQAWLGLSDFQQVTTSKSTTDYILFLAESSEEDLAAFRQFWQTEVIEGGKYPIAGGSKDLKAVRTGAKSDEELYLEYGNYLLRIIALAFGMSPRDLNILEPDNRATAVVSADMTFQDAVLPTARCIVEHLQVEVVDFYYPGFVLNLADTEPRGGKEEAEIAIMLFSGNIITRNKALQKIGEQAVGPQGDVYADGTIFYEDGKKPEKKKSKNDSSSKKPGNQDLDESDADDKTAEEDED